MPVSYIRVSVRRTQGVKGAAPYNPLITYYLLPRPCGEQRTAKSRPYRRA